MRITEYIKSNGGYISSAEVKRAGLYNQLLYGAQTGRIVRIRQGLYANVDGLSKQMIDVDKIVPGGVLCLYSAWFYHTLSTQIPQAHHVAIERNRKVVLPKFPPITLSYMQQDIFELGIEHVEIDGFKVKVYNLEKSVCDAIKYRNKIGIDVSAEILKNYLARNDRNLARLYDYASKMRVRRKIDELIKYLL